MTVLAQHPFDVVTRVLAERMRGLEPSAELRAMAIAGALDREGVVKQASEHFVLAAFAAAVRDLGLDRSLEPELRDFLAAVYAANGERNRGLRDQLMEVVATLNQVGIEPVLLKGAIRLVDGLYPDPAWRMMRDLDVLVPDVMLPDAVRLLREHGYAAIRPIHRAGKDVKLWRQGGAAVELHRELCATADKRRPLRAVDVISGSRCTSTDGVRARVPSIEHQLAHLISHSQIRHFNYAYGRIALCDRLEAAALVHRSSATIDWDTVAALFTAVGCYRPLSVFLLSLKDGGLCSPPLPAKSDPLTLIQQWRITLQARSVALTRLSLYFGWCVVLLKLQLMERDAGRPKIGRTLRKLVVDREERRRIARTFVQGAPRPW